MNNTLPPRRLEAMIAHAVGHPQMPAVPVVQLRPWMIGGMAALAASVALGIALLPIQQVTLLGMEGTLQDDVMMLSDGLIYGSL